MQPDEKILGVEGGGTKTAWVLVQREGEEWRVLQEGKLPPSNLANVREKSIGPAFFWPVVSQTRTAAHSHVCAPKFGREQKS